VCLAHDDGGDEADRPANDCEDPEGPAPSFFDCDEAADDWGKDLEKRRKDNAVRLV